nr:protoporphyrinogen oxidase [Candidatus Omnitrophota bacterium]
GGISGLAAAYRLSQSQAARDGGLKITVYEAGSHFGGVIQTESRGGFLMEKGPESFITTKPWALELCKELGLESELIATNERSRQSFILYRGRLFDVPQGFYLMAPTRFLDLAKTPLLSVRGKARAAMEWLIPARAANGDESLGSFIRRRFGNEILERLAQPLISGIYSADLNSLSLEATFPHFQTMEREHGSVIRALVNKKDRSLTSASGARYSLFLSLRGGMEKLIQTLIDHMPQVSFQVSRPVIRLEKKAQWHIYFKDGSRAEADAVCVAVPASGAWKILEAAAPALSVKLREIPYGTVATVNLAYRRGDLRSDLRGAGFVIAGRDRKTVMGCTFASQKFEGRSANSDEVLLRAFVGGRALAGSEIFNQDSELGALVCNELAGPLGIRGQPLHISIARWPESMPAYPVGHKERVRTINGDLMSYPGLYLTGNAYEGTGIPDCIRHAFKTADQILENFKKSEASHSPGIFV